MGDRALVVFTDDHEFSPVTYLHWSGYAVPKLLAKHKDLMEGREDDLEYAAARFIGICHEHTGPEANTGLGVWNLKDAERSALERLWQGKPDGEDKVSLLSHGDAGFILVRLKDMSWRAYGGYLVSSDEPLAVRD